MNDADRGQVTTDAAEVYERDFVPALFAQWVAPTLDAAGVGASAEGISVLDIACGTGIVAREARRRVGKSGRVVGIDVNPGMLTVAARMMSDIEWVEGVAEQLPFADDQFDAVVSQFGLMFFASRTAALQEMLRVLKPGGRYSVAVWNSLDTSPGYHAMVSVVSRLFGDEVASGLEAPFCLGNRDVLTSTVHDARLGDASIDTVRGTARFPSIAEWVETDIKGWVLSDAMGDQEIARLTREAERELSRFVGPTGTVAFDAPAHIVSGIKQPDA